MFVVRLPAKLAAAAVAAPSPALQRYGGGVCSLLRLQQPQPQYFCRCFSDSGDSKPDPIAMPILGKLPKTREGAIELYDQWATDYDRTLKSWDYPAPRTAAQILREHVDAAAEDCPSRVGALPLLDCGCGTGMAGEALYSQGFKNLLGSDISDASLEVCKNKGIYQGGLVNCDIESTASGKMPFEDNSLSGVACVGVLSYVTKFDKVFSEWCRCTAPGGLIVFTHISELWDNNLNGVQDAAAACPWVQKYMSPDPQPYMPLNPDPKESAKLIRYFVYQVE